MSPKLRHTSLPPQALLPRPSAAGGGGVLVLALARRKRLSLYLLAFAAMLVMSSVLDVRRASLRRAADARIHIVAPRKAGIEEKSAMRGPPALRAGLVEDERVSGKIEGEVAQPAAVAAAAQTPLHLPEEGMLTKPLEAREGDVEMEREREREREKETAVEVKKPAETKAPDRNISPQELKDDVEQFLRHVEEEELNEAESPRAIPDSITNETAVASAGERGSGAGAGDAPPGAQQGAQNIPLPPSAFAQFHLGAPLPGLVSVQVGEVEAAVANGSRIGPNGGNSTAQQPPELRLSVEELFKDGQVRLAALLASEKSRVYIDENDLRIVQALELQATRGDCEQPSASEGGSLFKSDAEAASSLDIEKTDPLYGAWCIFMGTYKSDAMRDFATKLAVVEASVVNGQTEAVLAEHKLRNPFAANARGGGADGQSVPAAVPDDRDDSAPSNSSLPHVIVGGGNGTASSVKAPFDPYAAQLVDVMDKDTQNMLASKLQFLRSHLQENELRYIAALSLQSAFGSCGPYGKELALAKKAKISNGLPYNDAGEELRLLTEPLTGETAKRREGALWGSWCVLVGKRRTSAAAELVDRITLLLQQLAKKQTAAALEGQDIGSAEEVDLNKDPVTSRTGA